VFNGYFKKPVTRLFIFIERQLAKLSDIIVTVSPAVRRELIEEYRIAAADKVRVVPLGFDFSWLRNLSAHRGLMRAEIGARDSTIVFGSIGRLAKIKNTELILRAFARLIREKASDARLVVVGDGELLGKLQSLARELAIEHLVSFRGWVLDRAKIFSDIDVTCLSSYNEGSPVCLIESLAAGIPVIATEVGGVADLVDRGVDGELVESNNEEAFAAAMARMAYSRKGISSGRSAEVRARYSISRLTRDIESLYEEVLERNHVPVNVAGRRQAELKRAS
jgi:glycosyltransferase involved in cell wall biosynthesis